MVRVVLVLAALAVVFIVFSAIDCAAFPRERIRGVNRGVWMLIILLLPVVGALLWLLVGRAARPPILAPDDDAAFMAELGKLIEEEHGSGEEPKA